MPIAAEAQAELRSIVGDQWFLHQADELLAYSYDATPMYQKLPAAVVLPSTTAEVAAVVRAANKHGFKIVTRGSGTNLSAGAVPVSDTTVVMAMTRMNKIREIDQENLTATLEPGVITASLHRAVEAVGLFYAPDPGSMNISTIGGNVAESSGGLRGLKYGVTKDWVMGLEAVLPSGEIVRCGGKNAKDRAGYDLTRLIIGSEGTLAVITEVLVRLIPLPEAKRTATATFASLEDSARAVQAIIANRIIPVTLEFLDNATIRSVEAFAKIGLPVDAAALLLIEQDGPLSICERDITRMAELCRENGALEVKVAATPEEGAQLMTARRTALTALARKAPTTILEDATVPRSKLAEMVKEVARVAGEYRLDIATFGHAGDGNLHPTCCTDERNPDEIHRVEAAFAEIFEIAVQLGGTITGEHGVGVAKAPYLEWKVGKAGLEAMRAIKQAWDPTDILNPGKMFANQSRKRVVVRHG